MLIKKIGTISWNTISRYISVLIFFTPLVKSSVSFLSLASASDVYYPDTQGYTGKTIKWQQIIKKSSINPNQIFHAFLFLYAIIIVVWGCMCFHLCICVCVLLVIPLAEVHRKKRDQMMRGDQCCSCTWNTSGGAVSDGAPCSDKTQVADF